ncbi:NADH-quinone oxidoreductase subunit K [Reticulibacter mediterranei]|uniref:NADH-quinone oxidoreductase subunit K n=1 Tax=Reticulibacter mediterranei TaxID=2778369 RepID=A0A8J3J5M3_9CHLR|nr:NADH-quinone oxidoreductase subunit NuoK [Reticulibacter mediterranei]GHP01167.1 NADH-quinone oxidoreductase subunit K [Reticulibacter mediterranei]
MNWLSNSGGPGLLPYLLVGALIFGIGVVGVLSQRSALMVLMSVEIIMNAAILTLVAFWRFVRPDQFDAQVFVIIIVTIAAVEMAAGLGLTLLVFRQRGNANVDEVKELKQ